MIKWYEKAAVQDNADMVMTAPKIRSSFMLPLKSHLPICIKDYSTILELACAGSSFPGELDAGELFGLNAGLLCLHLFIGGICFLASCLFSDTRYSIGLGAGIPAFMYVLQMLANVGGNAEKAKYFTFFTLFRPEGLISGEGSAIAGALLLLAGAAVLYGAGIAVFDRKNLHI